MKPNTYWTAYGWYRPSWGEIGWILPIGEPRLWFTRKQARQCAREHKQKYTYMKTRIKKVVLE